jgi:hypothetical protein
MTTEALARLFDRPRREGKAWRARCPVHGGKSLTLAIYADDDRSTVRCYAGCESDDVLAAVGLTWKQTFYRDQRIDQKEWLEQKRQREIAEKRAGELRIGTWILRFIENGYTREDRDEDVTVIAACAIVLTNKPNRTWEGILRTTAERIAAADHCLSRRMLPAVAKERR